MKVLPILFPDAHGFTEALLDSILLTLFSTPFVYWFVIRPYIKENTNFLEKISHMAYHDPLTGLANRRLLSEYIDKEVHHLVQDRSYGAILLIDLDGFKAVNDTYGHLAGDHLLVEISERLKSITRDSDLISRIGGDEFVILINKFDNDAKAAEEKSFTFSQKIIDEMVKPIAYNEDELHVNASIGIRIYDSVQIGCESLLREADTAMYASKKNGKGRATLYTDALNDILGQNS